MRSILVKLLSVIGLTPKVYYTASLEIIYSFTSDYISNGYTFPADIGVTKEQLDLIRILTEKK